MDQETLRVLRLIDRRNQERFETLYTAMLIEARFGYAEAKNQVEVISRSINQQCPIPEVDYDKRRIEQS